MRPSPIGSRILSLYAVLFAGLIPAALMVTAVVNGVSSPLIAAGNIAMSVAIVYYGIRVFAGDYSVARNFALLVAISYLGLTAANAWYLNDFPADSRAAQMAVPRMIRGVLFAAVYIWYYWFRKKTVDGFFGPFVGNAPKTSSAQHTHMAE